MLILGIDPGLNFTGYAPLRVTGAKRELLTTGTLDADQERPWFDRIDAQATAFIELLHQFGPNAVAIENYVYQGPRSHNPGSLWLARLVGRFEGIARMRGVEVITIDKSTCNRALGLKGKVSADRIRAVIALVFKSAPKTDHECDAVLAAVGGAQRVGRLNSRVA